MVINQPNGDEHGRIHLVLLVPAHSAFFLCFFFSYLD